MSIYLSLFLLTLAIFLAICLITFLKRKRIIDRNIYQWMKLSDYDRRKMQSEDNFRTMERKKSLIQNIRREYKELLRKRI
tara:strand:+ start:280 stop:519 length:240 start_codon:yes stop_codon:yes gene_type:complete